DLLVDREHPGVVVEHPARRELAQLAESALPHHLVLRSELVEVRCPLALLFFRQEAAALVGARARLALPAREAEEQARQLPLALEEVENVVLLEAAVLLALLGERDELLEVRDPARSDLGNEE